jgi:basic membrane protein A
MNGMWLALVNKRLLTLLTPHYWHHAKGHIMKKALLLSALTLIGSTGLAAPAATEDKIGFIYVGPAADAGYNTSMDDGRKYVEKNMPGVTTTSFELIPETAEVERVMERLIASGHKIIFATSYGYLDYAIKVGEKHPDVTILHAGGAKTSKKAPSPPFRKGADE